MMDKHSYLISSAAFTDSVTSVEAQAEAYRRALYQIDRRTVRTRLAPAHGARRADLEPVPTPDGVDPWQVDPAAVEAETRVLSTCPTCAGAKTVACGFCNGTARVRCGHCGGGGRVQGQRGPKNCPDCRGKGDVKCTSCRAGKVDCSVCDAAGLVHAWLVVHEERLQQVCAHPQCAAMSVHRDVREPADFDAGPKRWRNHLDDDTGIEAPPAKYKRGLRPELDGLRDRVVSARIQSFSATVFRVSYATAFSSGFVEVAGRPPAIAASTDWKPLSRRRALVVGAAAVGAIAAIWARGACVSRHRWFELHGYGGLVLLLGLVAAGLATLAVAGFTLAPKARATSRTVVPAILAALALGATSLAYSGGGPTKAGAERALAAGDIAGAYREAAALIDLGTDRTGGEQVEDALHLKTVELCGDAQCKAQEIGKPWHDEARRGPAVELLRTAVEGEAARAYAGRKEKDLEVLAATVEPVEVESARRCRGFALLARAQHRVEGADFSGAKELLDQAAAAPVPADEVAKVRAGVLEAARRRFAELVGTGSSGAGGPHGRRDALDAAISLRATYAQLGGDELEPPPDVLRERLAGVTKEVAAADKRAAELAAQEEAKRKREEAIAEAKRKQEEAFARAREAAEAADDDGGPANVGGGYRGGGRHRGGGHRGGRHR
jgi:hypothetical protein